MFGLTQPRVQRAIEKLPGAARCDRYLGWREGEQPEAPPLVSSLVLVAPQPHSHCWNAWRHRLC